MKKRMQFQHDCGGYAVVEATILFPIIIMIFYAMVMLAIYLPQRVILQEAVQAAATAIATEESDSYVSFDDNGNYVDGKEPENVYAAAVESILAPNSDAELKAASIVEHYAGRGVLSVPGGIQVTCESTDFIIYQEIMIRASQKIETPVNFSFIGFPTEIEIVQEARVVVQNGDEFVRNIDIAKDIMIWLDNKLGISQSLKESGALDKVSEVLDFFGF